MTLDEVMFEAEAAMEKGVEHLHHQLATVRTGKASPALVENMMVEAYAGTTMRLKELAAITAPEARMLLIQPWDMATVDPVRKALESSQLGITPLVDGKLIRIPFPELSQQRREELVKNIRKIAEDQRVAIRHSRREAMEAIKKLQKDGKITEDELTVSEKEVQKLTDKFVADVDKHLAQKEKELMQV
ncbi:MAG TPA: ribosome recycling factor [Verrucomicrobiae bacterium]|nr:ribosome recycling factor [Verrucomicrobiae bacterium]